MAYRLYLDWLRNPPFNKWPKSKFFYNNSTPLKFVLDGKEKDSFKIEEIDSLLCSFKNREEFIKELKSHNISYLNPEERIKDNLVLAYNAKGQIIESDIIFNDKLLFEQAINLRNMKKNAKKGSKVLTEHSERLDNYICYIKSLAINKTTSDFILNPESISYLTLPEKAMLNSPFLNSFYIKIDNGSTKNYRRLGLKDLLKNYVIYKNQEQYLSDNCASTLDIEKEIEEVDKKISLFFRQDYRNLRMMIEWESEYKEVLLSCLNKEELSDYEKEIIKVQLQKIDLAKRVRNRDNVTEEDICFLTMDEKYIYYEILDIDQDENKGFNNPKIEGFYAYGGIETVMEQIDLDEILNSPEDAIKLGIIQKAKKRD